MPSRCLPARRRRQLLPQLRICFKLSGNCSSVGSGHPATAPPISGMNWRRSMQAPSSRMRQRSRPSSTLGRRTGARRGEIFDGSLMTVAGHSRRCPEPGYLRFAPIADQIRIAANRRYVPCADIPMLRLQAAMPFSKGSRDIESTRAIDNRPMSSRSQALFHSVTEMEHV